MRSVGCDLCGNSERVLLWKGGRFDKDLSNVICKNCGLVYVSPRKKWKDFEDYYKKEYRQRYIGSDTPTRSILIKREVVAKERVKWLNVKLLENRFSVKGKKVLDIGCSSGNFLKRMGRHGWDLYGVDMTEGFTKFARENYGLKNVRTSSFEKSGFKNNFFDLITLFHVLEHVDSPTNLLAEVHNKLKNDGILVIEVPDIKNPYGGNLNFFFQDAHLYNFSENTLESFLLKTNFKLIIREHVGDFLRVVARKVDRLKDNDYINKFDNPTEVKEVVLSSRKKYFLLLVPRYLRGGLSYLKKILEND